MKIALICPSNLLFMPYVYNYEVILRENNIQYTIINWDRHQIELEKKECVYRDYKQGHQRNLYDYLKFRTFVIKQLKECHFDKVIIFGIQLSCFLGRSIMKEFKNNYLVDIRDHHRMIDFPGMKQIITSSAFTVISSPGYKKFLPLDGDYVINHNTLVESQNEGKIFHNQINKKKITIACIGALRDLPANTLFIGTLKNNPRFNLVYHGDGEINRDLQKYISENEINNVTLTGRYTKAQEEEFYKKCDFVNVIHFYNGMNDMTFLPNRLYNAVKFRKPLLVLAGNCLAEHIKKYRLGLVLETLGQLEERLINYIDTFNQAEYESGVQHFLSDVISDNQIFKARLLNFCGNNRHIGQDLGRLKLQIK